MAGDPNIITPHPLIDLNIDYFLTTHADTFYISVVMENPRPVSINELYTTFRGKKNLTNAGRAYRDGLAALVARASFDWKRAHRLVYQDGGGAFLVLALYFEKLTNDSWKPNGRTTKGSPQSPHKIQDSANYIKIAEDAVAQGCGINDCNNMEHLVLKAEDKLRPRTELIYIVHP